MCQPRCCRLHLFIIAGCQALHQSAHAVCCLKGSIVCWVQQHGENAACAHLQALQAKPWGCIAAAEQLHQNGYGASFAHSLPAVPAATNCRRHEQALQHVQSVQLRRLLPAAAAAGMSRAEGAAMEQAVHHNAQESGQVSLHLGCEQWSGSEGRRRHDGHGSARCSSLLLTWHAGPQWTAGNRLGPWTASRVLHARLHNQLLWT